MDSFFFSLLQWLFQKFSPYKHMYIETQSFRQPSKTHETLKNCLQDSQFKYILEKQSRDRSKDKRGAHFDSAYAQMEIKQIVLLKKKSKVY